ncbi:arylsulfatase [Parabacteroides sp. 52]|uniref:sulfatase family protein n=1 Tax=unclassified Parabacteroides TaxID=2649774 RepID=UPI0013CFD05B|nr:MULTISPECIES: sulfatase [unclassified Parabacteroides]MDH6533860.1 arylsulfatase A-like enzyme [Parabacteroides sp. PM5-20]NDV54606.1 arylsulfatase [Parabacteroides sp. 52]
MNNKKPFLSLLSTLALTGFAADHTNFIIINLDDVGYGDFSFNSAYGYKTPNIDKMASEGVRFTHFLAAQPISGASRAGLLTGCYPNRIGFAGAPGPGSDYGVHPDEMTIGEVLKQKGYHTAIYGKWHLGDAPQFLPLQNGFDEYYGLPYSNDMWPFHPQQGEVFNFPDLPTYEGNTIVGYNTDQSRFTTDYTNRTINFIQKHQKEPFFVYLAHSMPHVPLFVSDKFKGKSEQGLFGDVMMEIDWSVGEVLRTLRELGLEENTLVILTSDNGPWTNYGNHAGSAGGLREAKATTFDGGNRIPCVMYWKGQTLPGTTCNRLASNIDLLPTLAEISGAPLPVRKIDGVSLLPLIQGDNEANPRESFVYYFNRNDLEAVTDGMFKLVFPHRYVTYGAYVPGNDGQPGKLTNIDLTKAELYDLRRDPGERYDVLSQYPEVALKLMNIADNMREELGDNLTRKKGNARREAGKAVIKK